MDPKQLFPAHYESVFGKNKVLFPRELKKKHSQGIKKSIIPKKCSQNGPKFGQISPKMEKQKQNSQNTTFPLRERSELVGFSTSLSMVTWHHQNILNGYYLIMFSHLFKAESGINDFILRSESSQNYLFFSYSQGN